MFKNMDKGYALTLPQSRLSFGQAGHVKVGWGMEWNGEYSNSYDVSEVPRKKKLNLPLKKSLYWLY